MFPRINKSGEITIMNKPINQFPLLCAVIGTALAASSAFAGTPPANVEDIVYQDAGWGSQQLRARGYTMISSDWHNGKNVEYWWANGPNVCLKAKEANNKYESLSTTSSTDCNQYHEEATKNDNAAGIAVAAAAILGIAVLASQSHQRSDKHNSDANSTAEFDRGYRDGLHQKGYHNYNKTDAYSDGYSEGQIQRDDETRHHSNSGHHSGYQAFVSLNDLQGARAAGADSDLRARGFTDTGGYKTGDTSYVTWWNASTRQCVNVATQNGRIRSIEAISEGVCN